MASLTIAQKATDRQAVSLKKAEFVVGRSADCDLVLPHPAVSRRHAAIVEDSGGFFLEDLGSSNGTLLNGQQVLERIPLQTGDVIQIGGIDLRFHGGEGSSPMLRAAEVSESPTDSGELPAERILAVLDVGSSLRAEHNAEVKLQAIAELSRGLGDSLDLHEVLSRVLESIMQVFPQADWATVVLSEDGSNMVPHAIRSRPPERSDLETIHPISRTLARRVLSEGVAVLSSDVQADDRFSQSRSIFEFGIHSVMCAPLIGSSSPAMGLLTVESQAVESPFTETDLDVLVSVARLCAQSVQYARLHETLLAEREEADRVMREAAAERQQLQEQLLSISEQEQQRIGQELHDDVGQELTGLALLMEHLTGELSREKSEHAELARRLGKQSRQTLRKVRMLSHGLVPVAVDAEGLKPALAILVHQINEMRGPVCRFQCEAAVPLPDAGVATNLYRIAQEAMTNSLKHSQARHIDVQLGRQGSCVTLMVSDDGIGMAPPDPEEPTSGLGLRTMQHRAALIGAELTIARGKNRGTIVRCDTVLPEQGRSPLHRGGWKTGSH